MNLSLQSVIVGLIVAAAALHTLWRFAPRLRAALLAGLAHRLGLRAAPFQAQASCASGCAACGACPSSSSGMQRGTAQEVRGADR